jgi:hypothetical protein
MRVSEVFTMAGGRGYGGSYSSYLGYGGVDKPGGYYPDNGRWTYVAPNDYRWASHGYGYGYSRSHGLDGLLG